MLSDIFNSFLVWVIKKRIRQIELFMEHPDEVQINLLASNISKSVKTEYGRRYGFDNIENYADFARDVPIVTYEEIEPEIERIRNGEQNILWPSEIRWFAKSSGTTNAKSKYIPLSSDALEDCHFKAGKDMLALYFNNKNESKIFTGRSLRLGGSTQISSINNQSYFGDLSAILIENFPVWVELRSTPSREISLMPEWESKMEAIANSTMKEDVTSLAGVPSWMLVLMNHILKKTGASNIQEIWPNLELYLHGGVSFEPFRRQFDTIMPDKNNFHYMEIYNASEGFFGIQDQLNSKEMLLMLDYGIFYEFIPLDKMQAPYDYIIPLAEVETGVVYVVIISTNGGLWRYNIGDTITFTSTRPYRFQIAGRTKHHINVFGEELMVGNADRALEMASEESDCLVKEYSAAPVFMEGNESGAHEWIVEFSRPPKNLDVFTEALDRHLKTLNSDYEAKRHKNMALKKPILHQAHEGVFYQWLKNKNKLGGQHKVPRLSNQRDVLNELLDIHRKMA
ncbi:MAG: GH3 auxin-responsive promoter family protein [Cryomorphaceae bacterium]|nr:GH3 auxin-responsive promoter family protein [Cryomorphaceae bacterium]